MIIDLLEQIPSIYDEKGRLIYTRYDCLPTHIRVLDVNDILDHENFVEDERYLFIYSLREILQQGENHMGKDYKREKEKSSKLSHRGGITD